jgi:hypothetical protein
VLGGPARHRWDKRLLETQQRCQANLRACFPRVLFSLPRLPTACPGCKCRCNAAVGGLAQEAASSANESTNTDCTALHCNYTAQAVQGDVCPWSLPTSSTLLSLWLHSISPSLSPSPATADPQQHSTLLRPITHVTQHGVAY